MSHAHGTKVETALGRWQFPRILLIIEVNMPYAGELECYARPPGTTGLDTSEVLSLAFAPSQQLSH
jgi:hypothetical protein